MKSLCLHSLVILLLQTHVKSQAPCGERNVTGAVGGAVTLRVTDTGFKNIAWSFGEKGESLATIIPGGPIIIQDAQKEGRLSTSSDGSLTITNLQHEDQGTYRARIVTDVNLECFYHLSVFRNLTSEDITISYNVTDKRTCEVILTCSVNSAKKSNLTVTWRSPNSSDIPPPTENVVLVPPSHNHLPYLCTANNPVSSASKSVSPREHCKRNDPSRETTTPRTRIAIIVAVVITIIIIIIIIIVVCWNVRQKRSGSVSENKEKIPITNAYEFNDEEGAACAEAQGDKEQKPGKERTKQNNVKGKQGPSVSVVTTVYDEVHPSQATDSKESPSEVDTGNTLYSTVQHVKGKNGKKSKAPKGAVSNPPAESCYAMVQLPVMDKNGRKMSSEGGNSTAPEESCYEKDKNNPKVTPISANRGPPKAAQELPNKPSDPSKTSPKGANRDLPKTPVESCYAEVTVPK